MSNLRIGHGFDVHPFKANRDLVLGGEHINYKSGLDGHSDADVLIHSIIDSLLSASNLGNIGSNFPDNEDKYKNISSIDLLKEVCKKLGNKNIKIINIDSTVICQEPKISPYIEDMKRNISTALDDLEIDRIGVKGKTTERLGFTGRGEGITVHTVALIELSE